MSPLARSVESIVATVQAEREATWIDPSEVDDEWPVSEDEKVLDDEPTQPFTREQVDTALRDSSPYRCETLRSFPAPQSGRVTA